MSMSEPLLSPTDFSFEIYKLKEVVRFSEIISMKLLWNQLSTLQMLSYHSYLLHQGCAQQELFHLPQFLGEQATAHFPVASLSKIAF